MRPERIKELMLGYRHQQDGYRHYAVLIPLIEVDEELHVLYEIRSKKLKHQPGEICFPGGRHEEDEIYLETALRETIEELGVDPEAIEIIGQLDDVITPFNMYIHVYLGILTQSLEELVLSDDEVESIFTVPVDFLMTCKIQEYKTKANILPPKDFPYEKIEKGYAYEWKVGHYPVLFIDYDRYHIWGITARITANLISTLKDLSEDSE